MGYGMKVLASKKAILHKAKTKEPKKKMVFCLNKDLYICSTKV